MASLWVQLNCDGDTSHYPFAEALQKDPNKTLEALQSALDAAIRTRDGRDIFWFNFRMLLTELNFVPFDTPQPMPDAARSHAAQYSHKARKRKKAGGEKLPLEVDKFTWINHSVAAPRRNSTWRTEEPNTQGYIQNGKKPQSTEPQSLPRLLPVSQQLPPSAQTSRPESSQPAKPREQGLTLTVNPTPTVDPLPGVPTDQVRPSAAHICSFRNILSPSSTSPKEKSAIAPLPDPQTASNTAQACHDTKPTQPQACPIASEPSQQ